VNHGVLVNFAKGKALTLEFAGHLYSNPASECMPLDRSRGPRGDEVQVPNVGTYTAATVKRVDAAIGRVFVDLNGKEVGVSSVDVAPALDAFGVGFVAPSGGAARARPARAARQPAEGGEGKAGKGGKAKGGQEGP